jgi:hypothetical protein
MIDNYKGCLVAKDYKQQYGIDYGETFSPVVKATTIWLVFVTSLMFTCANDINYMS